MQPIVFVSDIANANKEIEQEEYDGESKKKEEEVKKVAVLSLREGVGKVKHGRQGVGKESQLRGQMQLPAVTGPHQSTFSVTAFKGQAQG